MNYPKVAFSIVCGIIIFLVGRLMPSYPSLAFSIASGFILFLAGRLMRSKFRRFEKRPDFMTWWNDQEPPLSLTEALSPYIDEYDLALKASLDEPARLTVVRTKIAILEEMLRGHPGLETDENVMTALLSLKAIQASLEVSEEATANQVNVDAIPGR